MMQASSAFDKLCDYRAEWCLIGSVLLSGDPIAIVDCGVEASDFYYPDHKLLWEAVMEIHKAGLVVDLPVLYDRVKSHAIRSQQEWLKLLVEISNSVETSLNITHWADKVRKFGGMRAAIREAGMIELEISESGNMNLLNAIGKLNQINARINGVTQKMSMGLSVKEVRQRVIDRRNGVVIDDGFDGPYPMLDRRVGKQKRGKLTAIAARPGVGKSVDGMCRLLSGMRNGYKQVFFSLEMGVEEIIERIVSNVASVNMLEIENEPESKVRDMMRFFDWFDKVENSHIFDDVQSIDGIVGRIEHIHQTTGVDQVYIDYLQLVVASNKALRRDEQLGDITRQLKLLALRLKIDIYFMSQLNRECEKDGRPPRLSDIRESGNIEQDCDRVFFIYRPKENCYGSDQSDAIDCVQYQYILEKNRYGPAHIGHWLQFDAPFQRLTEIDLRSRDVIPDNQPNY